MEKRKLGYVWFQKVKEKNIKKNDFIIFDYSIKYFKEN